MLQSSHQKCGKMLRRAYCYRYSNGGIGGIKGARKETAKRRMRFATDTYFAKAKKRAHYYIHFLNGGIAFRLAVSKAHIAKIMISQSTMAITT